MECSELVSGDLGEVATDCVSLGLRPRECDLELARDGGGLKSGDGASTLGEVVGGAGGGEVVVGGTMVASDFWLPDNRRASDLGGGSGCWYGSSFEPFSSASSVISINRRRRSELEEEVIEPDAVWRRHADDKALSFKSDAWAKTSTVSFGVNLSVTD